MAHGTAAGFPPEQFKSAFGAIKPLLLKEWTAVDAGALEATQGEMERVVAAVADATRQPSSAVRPRIEQIATEATRNGTSLRDANHFLELLERLEKKTTDLANELKSNVLPSTREKMKQNLFVTLLMALGLGIILGLLFGGGGRGRR
jgi:hypothetical protein